MVFGTRTLLLLLWGYVATSRYYLVGSLQIGDLIALACLAFVVLTAAGERAFTAFFVGAYGWIAGAASIAVLAVSLAHATPLSDFVFATQFALVVWVVVPLIALSVAFAPDPLRTLERSAWAFVILYLAGAVLLFAFGKTWFLYMVGSGRVFSHYVFYVFQQIAACVAVVQLIRRKGSAWRYALLLTLSAVPVVLSSTRTGIVILALLALIALMGSVRTLRGLAVGVISVAMLTGLLTATAIHQSLGVRIITANAFLDDTPRLRAMSSTIERLQDQPSAMLWGLGWGKSGDGLVVHNLLLQLSAEGGVGTCALILALLTVPWVWAVGTRRELQPEALLASLLTLVVWLNLLLNAFSVERVYWLAFAVALGLAYRSRKGPAMNPAAAQVPAAA